MELYTFFRSGTSHRVRIALNLKGLSYQHIPIDLRTEAHSSSEFRAINPQGFVPALKVDGKILTQSPAILEWLEEVYPLPHLLPQDLEDRTYVRTINALLACDIHPLNNRRVLERLRNEMGQSEEVINAWCVQWITDGFAALESLIMQSGKSGEFCFGNEPSLADVYLIPQVDSSKRFKVDLSPYPSIQKIYARCMQLDAFQKAAPMNQPDAS